MCSSDLVVIAYAVYLARHAVTEKDIEEELPSEQSLAVAGYYAGRRRPSTGVSPDSTRITYSTGLSNERSSEAGL